MSTRRNEPAPSPSPASASRRTFLKHVPALGAATALAGCETQGAQPTPGRGEFTPEQFGAVGDGQADDTQAWQHAIAAALATGGRITCGSNQYKITAGLTLRQTGGRPVFITGRGQTVALQVAGQAGTTLVWAGPAGGTMLTLSAMNGGGVDGLALDCGATNPAAVGLALDSTVGARLSRIAVYRAAQWGFTMAAVAAGVYQNVFEELFTDATCNGGMRLEARSPDADVALNTYLRTDLNYSGPNGGLDLAAADNNLFVGLVLRCPNGNTGGPMLILRGIGEGVNYGARWNVFMHVDGNTGAGPQRPVQADVGSINDVPVTNVAYGWDYANGLPSPSGEHPENFLVCDTGGTLEGNLLQLKTTHAFGAGKWPLTCYSDRSANALRLSTYHASIAQGFRVSNRVGDGDEQTIVEVDGGGNHTIPGSLKHNGSELSFFGAPLAARPLLATGAGHTVDDVIAALQQLGLVRQS